MKKTLVGKDRYQVHLAIRTKVKTLSKLIPFHRERFVLPSTFKGVDLMKLPSKEAA